MRLKPIVTLITVIGFALALSLSGCGNGSEQPQSEVDTRSANVAPSDYTPAVKPNPAEAAKEGAKVESAVVSADSSKTEINSIVDKGGDDFAEREEIRRSYTLKPGAGVRVSGINGRIDAETTDTDHAEVLIVRSAKKREDLQYRKIIIDHDPMELHIRVEDDRRSFFSAFGPNPENRQRVILKLPRKIRFNIARLNGDVAVGEIEGGLDVRGVNGKINIEQLTGGASFRNVNGRIDATVANLSAGNDIDIVGVNGPATLRFVGEVNAYVETRSHNGRVESDLPNLQENKDAKRRHGQYRARIGTGGPQIEIRGVSGDVFLMKAEKQTETTAKKSPK